MNYLYNQSNKSMIFINNKFLDNYPSKNHYSFLLFILRIFQIDIMDNYLILIVIMKCHPLCFHIIFFI